jgi:hypothetical protein
MERYQNPVQEKMKKLWYIFYRYLGLGERGLEGSQLKILSSIPIWVRNMDFCWLILDLISWNILNTKHSSELISLTLSLTHTHTHTHTHNTHTHTHTHVYSFRYLTCMHTHTHKVVMLVTSCPWSSDCTKKGANRKEFPFFIYFRDSNRLGTRLRPLTIWASILAVGQSAQQGGKKGGWVQKTRWPD